MKKASTFDVVSLSVCVSVCRVCRVQWALAKDGTGNYHYYNMSNSLITVAELPEVADTVSRISPCIWANFASLDLSFSIVKISRTCVCITYWILDVYVQILRKP